MTPAVQPPRCVGDPERDGSRRSRRGGHLFSLLVYISARQSFRFPSSPGMGLTAALPVRGELSRSAPVRHNLDTAGQILEIMREG